MQSDEFIFFSRLFGMHQSTNIWALFIGIPLEAKCSIQEDWHSALRRFAGLNPTVTDAGMCISSPVRGLRPLRDARDLRVKVPNPVIDTAPSFFTPSAIASSTAFTALSAAAREPPSSLATCSTNCDLFISCSNRWANVKKATCALRIDHHTRTSEVHNLRGCIVDSSGDNRWIG